MKSMALTGFYEIGMISTPDPVIRNVEDVLIRVTHMGVCGSDMHYYTTGRIGSNRVEDPFVLGHEGSGVVEHTGNGVRGLSKGQRIAIEPAMACRECDQCLSGRPNTCRNLKFLGNPGQSPGPAGTASYATTAVTSAPASFNPRSISTLPIDERATSTRVPRA